MKKGLFSKYLIKISSTDKCRVLSLILSKSLTCKRVSTSKDKTLLLTISAKDKDAFERTFSSNNVNAEFTEIQGYLTPLIGLKSRLGILLGFVLLFSILILSSKVVWKIDIEGNSIASDQEILNELSSAGFTEGTYIPSIDYDKLQNKILLNSKSLSWISINITGNVANVQVKEKSIFSPDTKASYSNIVANRDGYIEEIRVINGKKVVSIGQVVREGEVLISGVIDSQSQGVRYEEAKGEVLAYVNKEISIKIPYESSKKVYTGNKYTCKDYKLFDFYINFSSKYGNLTSFYDKIEKRENISIFGIKSLPVEIIYNTFYEYKFEPVVLSKQEAIDRAFLELRYELDKALKNSELINKTINTSYDESGFYVNCQLYCLEDIAKTQEFYVTK